MKRKIVRRAVLAVVAIVASAGGVLGALAFSGTQVYDLNDPRPATTFERVKTSILRYAIEPLLPLIYDERTRYAAGYTEEGFRSLKAGVSKDDVLRVLGEPLSRREIAGGRSIFYYSEQATARDNYLVRNVVFDSQGRLLERHAEFYVD